MKKFYKYIFGVYIIFIMGCVSETHYVKINNVKYKVYMPPGTVQVDSNFYVDKAEISNSNYLEYLSWLQIICKDSIDLYKAACPEQIINENIFDTVAISPYVDSLINVQNDLIVYFRHPAFQDYPVINISYEQAIGYCKWRSDRVFEKILIYEGIMVHNPKQNIENYFSIERYFNGMFSDSIPIVKDIPYPEYRLPTKKEWEKAALGKLDSSYIFGVDFTTKKLRKHTLKFYGLFNTSDFYEYYNSYLKYVYGDIELYYPYTSNVYAHLPNNFGLFQMIGNVSEMTEEKGIAKGGSWQHTLYDCNIFNDIHYSEASVNIGFRCVCEWKLP